MESYVLIKSGRENNQSTLLTLIFKTDPQMYTVKVSETVDFTDITSVAAILCPVDITVGMEGIIKMRYHVCYSYFLMGKKKKKEFQDILLA